jgi:4-amino-4-deoxy-L-arabinose transferase-like glycosyltransferase
MPIVWIWSTQMLSSLFEKIHKNKTQLLTVFGLLIIAGVSHGFNMFNYPYYENDEGTYMSQAWSLLTRGELAPYTYWYDHAPGGWILIALWVKLTGGFFTFGASVNSGRVLMLILHLLSTALLYFIAKRLSKSTYTGIIAVFMFFHFLLWRFIFNVGCFWIT